MIKIVCKESKGVSVEGVTSQFGLHQIINEPAHILENSSL